MGKTDSKPRPVWAIHVMKMDDGGTVVQTAPGSPEPSWDDLSTSLVEVAAVAAVEADNKNVGLACALLTRSPS